MNTTKIEIDYEKQFQDDLAKATAISLEQHALDEYNRTRKYGTTTYSGYFQGGSVRRDLDNRRPFKGTQLSSQQRRFSDVTHGSAAKERSMSTSSSLLVEQRSSKTPPPVATTTTNNDNDLISFSSPRLNPPDRTTFDKLIEDIQKLQTNTPQNTLIVSSNGYNTNTYVQPRIFTGCSYGVNNNNNASQTNLEMVSGPAAERLSSTAVQKKKIPLTAEELERLYSMIPTPFYNTNDLYQKNNVVGGYMPSYIQSTTSTLQNNLLTYGIPNRYNTMINSSASTVGNLSSRADTTCQNVNSAVLLHQKVDSNSAIRTLQPVPRKVKKGIDLIDLGQEDDARVSVLEAFDPLHNDVEHGNNNTSDGTSYYAEYDPFDYLYSGSNGTQYSDPVYEAVNKLDSSHPKRNAEFIQQQQRGAELSVSEKESVCTRKENTNYALVKKTPPPLPPRNSDNQGHISLGNNPLPYVGNSSALRENTYGHYDNIQIDQRKTKTRLYERLSNHCTFDPELFDFYLMVKNVRQQYPYDDRSTNIGHIIAAEFNYHYLPDTNIKILVYPSIDIITNTCSMESKSIGKQPIKGYGKPAIFTCNINTTVDVVINQAYCSLEGQINGVVSDYVVKPIGIGEWLSNTSKLSQLECVHNSLKLEKDVHLGLCIKSNENMQILARSQNDDRLLRPEDILPNEMASTITYENMLILIETLETEIDKLESCVSDMKPHTIVSHSGVTQALKAICALLGSIDTIKITDCVNKLKYVCQNAQMMKYSNSSHAGNPEVLNDFKDYAEVCLRPRSLLEQVKFHCNQLRDAVQELIELYTKLFRVDFSIQTLDYTSSSLHIASVTTPLTVHIKCLYRPPPIWKYDNYLLGIQINYGTRSISEPVVTKCSNDTSGGIFPRLQFCSWIEFEKNRICTLPRESRLLFVIYGTHVAENDGPMENEEKRQVTVELGWASLQLFNYKREMINGTCLLPVWPATTDKFLGPAPAGGCHPQPDFCPILDIQIPTNGGKIQFPEIPFIHPTQEHRYDFTSLDSNLQQELLDTVEQGYVGPTERREVFWEKRLYLQKFPNALAKVLHAAHSWDYGSLTDLHSLLYSWTPLSPLQALELLLPRYPDIKVREKAVEWISKLPNDQLVDYLPQLLESLKHDTYEISAMAKFLLSKCLESPRIAHHIYWLLVHSLPGDGPQNSIDNFNNLTILSNMTNTEINQARYYRRNKLMLRALLAVCGEKLSKRFLLQNLMCKRLADVAESVKEVKEPMRQKILLHGIESVHHELLENPTCLPLGPEHEVHGINVRNCSYFNSNTLPLKITFIGSDNELLPAIFKSGDDLQQDMLTIQLIRVMNKMWLSQGLDLKIVTFNCVPTGYKRGMIELVSDAETLRKIQVEYGLTGSFKDRPIAEWLAKQNPSQLEYQRAVKNFTVSCAGYSVATYILGICDRHNDNIMLKTSGHLFHIDFGKFLGDAQMFGNFKRDRTPFVLTSDMAYVINGGDKPSTEFHFFVDLCCRAFNIIRQNGDLLLHMLASMATAGIPGVTADAVTYVRKALLPSQSNAEAAASFAKMIQFSLKNWFTQFNFFLHNLAQMRFTNDDNNGELLSFVPRIYTMQEDGRLKSVMVVRCQKHYDMEKYYTYILEVTRHNQPDCTHLFRSYKEFTEFHQKLCLLFPLAKLHSLSIGLYMGRSNVKTVAERRLPEIQKFLQSLFMSADEIAHSNLVYTFFHPLLRDQQEANLGISKVKEIRHVVSPLHDNNSRVSQLKLSLQYRQEVLTVMIHHAKGLPLLQGGQEPNTYVKCYLKPDVKKMTKRKTRVVRKTCVPSYMETLEYRMPLEVIKNRILHVTVWSHDTLQENELLGAFQIDLSNYNLQEELIDWFRLSNLPRH